MENIANLIPQEDMPGGVRSGAKKSQRYVSIHSKKAREEVAKSKKVTGGFLGKATVRDSNATKNFMKKGTYGGAGSRVKNPSTRSGPLHSTKPAVPRHGEKPLMGLKTKKNYLKDNARDSINTKARPFEQTMIDGGAGSGGRFKVEESGLVPKYSKKKDYGMVPDYLNQFKSDKESDEAQYAAYLDEMQKENAMYEVSQAERAEVLAGLKHNWDIMKREYQLLSVVTDTAPKKIRKTRMESQLAQIEADIQKLERHQIIYVAN